MSIGDITRLIFIVPPAILAAAYMKSVINDLKEQYRETGRLFAKDEN